MKDAPKLLKIPKLECPDIWIRLPRHKWAKIMVQYGRSSRSSWAKSVRSSSGRTVMGKAFLRGSYWSTVWKRFPIGNASSYTMKKDCSYLCVCVDDINKLAGKKQNIDPMWKVLNKDVDLGEPTSFLDHVYLGCTQRQCEISKDIVDNYRQYLNPEFPQEHLKNYHAGTFFVFLHGPTMCKVMWRNVWNDIASWQTGRLNNSTKYLHHALMTIISKKKTWSVCRRIVKSVLSNCSEMLVLGTYWKT